jgi:serine/threonine protein kinase
LVYDELENDHNRQEISLEKTDLNYFELIFGDDTIKPRNYHMDQKLVVKLADFGLAKDTGGQDLMSRTVCGTPFYMAPELLIDGTCNSKVDLWAFGTIMYEMLFHNYPIEATTYTQLKIKMKEVDINFNTSNNFTKSCFDLLIRLLNKDYKNRINWENFFNHEWFLYWKKRSLGEPFPREAIETFAPNSGELEKKPSGEMVRRSSNLTKMKLTRYDNSVPGTYSEVCFNKKKDCIEEELLPNSSGCVPEDNINAIPIVRPFPKLNLTKSVSMPAKLSSSNSYSVPESNYPHSYPQTNKSGIIRNLNFTPTIIDNYDNPSSVPPKSEPIEIQQSKTSYVKSAVSYITSPISYFSGTYNSPSIK